MIETEQISDRVLKVTVPEKLSAGDFRQLAPQIDFLLQQQGSIRLLVDASNFDGWENLAAFEKHIGFVKTHHQKVERIAVITAHDDASRQWDMNIGTVIDFNISRVTPPRMISRSLECP